MQMPNGNITDQQMEYYRLTSQGVPAQEAFNRAFPNGLDPSRIQREAANDQQKAALGQILGMLGGAVGVRYAGKALGGLLGSGAANAASTVADTANAASNVANTANAANTASNVASASGAVNTAKNIGNTELGLTPSGYGSYLGPALGAAGMIGGGATLYDLFKNKDHGASGAVKGALGAGSMAAGYSALAPLLGLGPLGWAGIGLAALLGGGAGFFGNFGDKDRWKEEQDKLKKLKDQGYDVERFINLPTGKFMKKFVI